MVTIYTVYSSPPPPVNWRSFDFTKSGSKLCRRFVYSVQDCRNLRQNKCRKTPPPRSISMMGKAFAYTIARLHP